MFKDYVTIKVAAGKGGNGIVAWRREKYIPKGGPAGGNGGMGGNVIICANTQLLSLENYRNAKMHRAENGKSGGSNNQQGRRGKNIILQVPVGTIVKDKCSQEILYDLTEDKQEVIICQGGKGGKGNTFFKSSTRRAPNYCTEGKVGEEKELELELKLIADVGLVGMPNAGKSTLLSLLTLVKVKIAPYPFTTLHPNLGLIEFDDFSRLLIADIPGIIHNAHKNKGLGISFLKHIERCSVLTYVLDMSAIDGRDPLEDFIVLQKEISSYSPQLKQKPYLVLLNKADTKEAKNYIQKFKKKYSSSFPFFSISALKNEGILPFIKEMKKLAQQDGKKF